MVATGGRSAGLPQPQLVFLKNAWASLPGSLRVRASHAWLPNVPLWNRGPLRSALLPWNASGDLASGHHKGANPLCVEPYLRDLMGLLPSMAHEGAGREFRVACPLGHRPASTCLCPRQGITVFLP
jgi:hypothetical protein